MVVGKMADACAVKTHHTLMRLHERDQNRHYTDRQRYASALIRRLQALITAEVLACSPEQREAHWKDIEALLNPIFLQYPNLKKTLSLEQLKRMWLDSIPAPVPQLLIEEMD